MAHQLDGARLKVGRAKKHLQSLKDEIGRYLDTRPYEFPAEHDGDTATAKPAIIKTQPPSDFGCILGDCLANLRPSLDYIAWELASRYSSTPLTPKKARLYFPLQKCAADFCANARPPFVKYSVPASAIDIMESVQPYHSGYEQLGLLSDFVNEDKHRLPLLTIAYVNTASIQISIQGPPIAQIVLQPPGSVATVAEFGASGMTVENLGGGKFSASSMVGRQTAGDATSPAATPESPRSMKVDGKVTVFVAIKNGPVPLEPVERTLEQILNCVANIIPLFDGFF
jgi:hypothetical protein